MEERLHSVWQRIKQRPYEVSFYVLLLLILFISLAYSSGWDWTGFTSSTSQITITSASKGNYTATISQASKSLWDWLQLLGVLAVPVVVGLGAAWFTAQQGKVSDRENKDNQREAALQAYIDKISELLFKEHLGDLTAGSNLKPEHEQVRKIERTRAATVLNQVDARRKREQVQKIARVRTITVLNQVDSRRAGYVFAFLREAGLQSNQSDRNIISFNNANLSKINLSEASLPEANLSGANLSHANLSGADLTEADLTEATLNKAIFSHADLSRCNFSEASVGSFSSFSSSADGGLNFEAANSVDWAANFEAAFFFRADLSRANFKGAYLRNAIFSGALLKNTNLQQADLSEAYLRGDYPTLRHPSLRRYGNRFVGGRQGFEPADLSGAILFAANLRGAEITEEQLKKAKTFEGATMLDGSRQPLGEYIPEI